MWALAQVSSSSKAFRFSHEAACRSKNSRGVVTTTASLVDCVFASAHSSHGAADRPFLNWSPTLVPHKTLAVSCKGFKTCCALVCFGAAGKISNDSSWLCLLDFQELAKGFAALAPVRVLWNLQGGVPGGAEGVELGSNTLVVGWIDYNVSTTAYTDLLPYLVLHGLLTLPLLNLDRVHQAY